jgi:hypothetical protein
VLEKTGILDAVKYIGADDGEPGAESAERVAVGGVSGEGDTAPAADVGVHAVGPDDDVEW